jgi:hypothetical protein
VDAIEVCGKLGKAHVACQVGLALGDPVQESNNFVGGEVPQRLVTEPSAEPVVDKGVRTGRIFFVNWPYGTPSKDLLPVESS